MPPFPSRRKQKPELMTRSVEDKESSEVPRRSESCHATGSVSRW